MSRLIYKERTGQGHPHPNGFFPMGRGLWYIVYMRGRVTNWDRRDLRGFDVEVGVEEVGTKIRRPPLFYSYPAFWWDMKSGPINLVPIDVALYQLVLKNERIILDGKVSKV